jgi:hypothetical protein
MLCYVALYAAAAAAQNEYNTHEIKVHMAETVVFLAFRDASFEFSSYRVMLKF